MYGCIGALMLSVSLCFDGLTGAYEDRLMSKEHVEPFDLMYNIQFGKAVISFCCLLITNQLGEFIRTLQDGGFMLFVLGLTGALGQVQHVLMMTMLVWALCYDDVCALHFSTAQVFVFVTIAKFGALNCALIGLTRKIFSLVLSFILYGHVLNAVQSVGLLLSITAMIANFYEKVRCCHAHVRSVT